MLHSCQGITGRALEYGRGGGRLYIGLYIYIYVCVAPPCGGSLWEKG